jgi:hypothetical protein
MLCIVIVRLLSLSWDYPVVPEDPQIETRWQIPFTPRGVGEGGAPPSPMSAQIMVQVLSRVCTACPASLSGSSLSAVLWVAVHMYARSPNTYV